MAGRALCLLPGVSGNGMGAVVRYTDGGVSQRRLRGCVESFCTFGGGTQGGGGVFLLHRTRGARAVVPPEAMFKRYFLVRIVLIGGSSVCITRPCRSLGT